MGLPRFWGRIETPVTIGPQDVGRKEDPAVPVVKDTRDLQVADGRLGIQWTIAYYALLVLGAWLFYQNLWTLTTSTHALVDFGSIKH